MATFLGKPVADSFFSILETFLMIWPVASTFSAVFLSDCPGGLETFLSFLSDVFLSCPAWLAPAPAGDSLLTVGPVCPVPTCPTTSLSATFSVCSFLEASGLLAWLLPLLVVLVAVLEVALLLLVRLGVRLTVLRGISLISLTSLIFLIYSLIFSNISNIYFSLKNFRPDSLFNMELVHNHQWSHLT